MVYCRNRPVNERERCAAFVLWPLEGARFNRAHSVGYYGNKDRESTAKLDLA